MKQKKIRILVFVGMGIELVSISIIGVFLGHRLDSYLGEKGFGVPLLLFLFLLIWVIHVRVLFRTKM